MTPRASTPNGLVKVDRLNRMWYKEADGTHWVRAVRHDDIRDKLITRASAHGQYTYPRAAGFMGNDVTAFHPDQEPWGEIRLARPAVLFEFERRDRKDPDYEVEPMMDEGRIVLDPDNHPVRDFHEIPATVSSAVEGWLMEAIRRINSKISAVDFRARMLRNPSSNGKGILVTVNAVDMRMTRWRQEHRCISWVNRGGSKAFKDHLWGLMTKEMRENNTTEGLEDVNDKGELAKMKLTNQGQHLSRAGPRAIPDHVRKQRQRKVIEKAERFDERQASKERKETTKRKRASPVSEEANDDSIPQSRRRKVNPAFLRSGSSEERTSTASRPSGLVYTVGQLRQSTASKSSITEKVLDTTPANGTHLALVDCLLESSRDDFLRLTKQVSPKITTNQCYWAQYDTLQDHLDHWWRQRGHTNLTPILLGLVAFNDTEVLWNKPTVPQLSAHVMGLAQALIEDDIISSGSSVPGSSEPIGRVSSENRSTQPPAGAPQDAHDNTSILNHLSVAAASEYTTSPCDVSSFDAVSAFQPHKERHIAHSVIENDSEKQSFEIWLETEGANAYQAHWFIDPDCTWETYKEYHARQDFDLQSQGLVPAVELDHFETPKDTNPPTPNNDFQFAEGLGVGSEPTYSLGYFGDQDTVELDHFETPKDTNPPTPNNDFQFAEGLGVGSEPTYSLGYLEDKDAPDRASTLDFDSWIEAESYGPMSDAPAV